MRRDSSDYLREILLSPVYDLATQTPIQRMQRLSERLQKSVYIKREDQQPIHSFKIRGAYHKMASMAPELLAQGVVAASAGNHAQGVAAAARQLSTHAVIVMPETTPRIKVDAVLRLGGEIILHGKQFHEAEQHARQLASEKCMQFLPPFDDQDVIAGQGTVGHEILQQLPDVDAIFVPVGGGGLLAGIAVYIKELKSDIKIFGVEVDESACLSAAMESGTPVDLEHVGRFADGVAVKRIGEETFRLAREHCDGVITVNSDAVCAAIKDCFEDCRAVAEPSGALAVAGIKEYVANNPEAPDKLMAILTGANLNFDTLRYISERCEYGEKSEAILAVEIPERKGSFRNFCQLIGRRAITEFNYRLADRSGATIFVGIKLEQGRDELAKLVDALNQNELHAIDLTDNELAKLHIRYMVGGRAPEAISERLFRFEFPEYPGALLRFLNTLGENWNISLFHYRNHGSAVGQVLAAFEDAAGDKVFDDHLRSLGYPFMEETDNAAFRAFLKR